MQRSTERFLTTHTGSLPRPDDLIRMMYAKEEGVPVDPAALAARVRQAVAEVVKKQAEANVDLINDGEMSKPSYATYIKDRLNGFGGTGNTFVYQDLSEFPRLEKRVFGDPGRSRRKTPACNAPISVRDAQAASTDADNLRAALNGVKSAGGFMSAASPGVVSLFFRNDHYPSQEAYLAAIAEAMRHEYETVAKAGLVLQIDCPDLAMGRHIQYADLSLPEFRKRAPACRGAQSCARQYSSRAAAHPCLLGQLRRPASSRCAAFRHHRHRVHGQAERNFVRSRQSTPRP
jgi:5-methyltetrahydropteroyltriglutamate--homocysteine methyltransferase